MPAKMIDAGSADEVLLTPQEASPLVKVAPKTLANWRSLGVGPAYMKLSEGSGGRIRYRLLDIKSFLAERRIEVA